MPSGNDFVGIAGGRYHSIGLKSDRSVVVWGSWGYKCHGQGEEVFNIDAGRTERYKQQYELQLSASLLLPLPGANPKITINQNLTMELLAE